MNEVRLKNGEMFSSIIRGVWQLARGHQPAAGKMTDPVLPLRDALEQGFYTFDCADIYVGTEQLLGQLACHRKAKPLRFHTKYVPDMDQLQNIKNTYTESIIDRSLFRLQVESLDLVQFHWWNYDQPYYLDALEHLARLQERGKIRAIGLTNFSSRYLEEILQAGFQIETLQLQGSLIDRRGQDRMKELCKTHGVKRLAYGSLLGGFLSELWLGKTEPNLESLGNRSLVKYKVMIEDAGGWMYFQEFLKYLNVLAKKYSVSIPQIAVQSLLQTDMADAAIVGLSPLHYQEQSKQLLAEPSLTSDDLNELLSWKFSLSEDVYELERKNEKHSKLMHTQLNRNS